MTEMKIALSIEEAADYTAQHATDAYQTECAKWEEVYGEKATP